MTNNENLNTISMDELYENVYRSRPPIIDGLLYPGTLSVCRCAEAQKEFLYGAACLPHQHGNSAVGILRP